MRFKPVKVRYTPHNIIDEHTVNDLVIQLTEFLGQLGDPSFMFLVRIGTFRALGEFLNSSETTAHIVGYIRGGDKITPDEIEFLKINTAPVEMQEAIIIMRDDTGAGLLIPREISNRLLTIESDNGLNIYRDMIAGNSWFDLSVSPLYKPAIKQEDPKVKKGFFKRLFGN